MKNENEIAAARNAAQILSRHKRLVIPRYVNGQFGMLMGKSNKTYHESICEILTMTSQFKLEIGIFFVYLRFISLDAIDKVKEGKAFRHGVKYNLNKFLVELDRLRTMLIYPPENCVRMFHLEDMPRSTRMMYRQDLTDKEYFEFWENQGMVAFNETHKHVYALQWRYEKALNERGVKKAKVLAWLATGSSMIEMYVNSYTLMIERFSKLFGYPKSLLISYYNGFDLTRARELWYGAMLQFVPDGDNILSDVLNERNVVLGLQQIVCELGDAERQLEYTRINVEENREVFSSKNYWLKAIDEVVSLKADLHENAKEYKEAKKQGIAIEEYFNMKRNEIKEQREIRRGTAANGGGEDGEGV